MPKCKTCLEDKPDEKFRNGKSGGMYTSCMLCRSRRDNKNMKTDPVRYLYHLAYGRRGKHEFNLTLDYLRGIWDAQSGVCALSGLSFAKFETAKDPYNPSLDRIDPTKGYVIGNVRFVLWGINNAMNQWGLETYLHMASAVLKKQD